MSAPPIGSLRHRLVLEEPVRTPDGGGGSVIVWSSLGEVWAAIRTTGGGERPEAGGLAGRVSHEITLRRGPALAPAMRLRLGTRVFAILAVLDRDEGQGFVRCLAEERRL